jgi:hypothetical protein
MLQYITIFQNDHKDETHDVYFCQWTGYQDVLIELITTLSEFEDKFDGEYGEGYSFSYNLAPIPESAVDALSGIYTNGRTGVSFEKHNAADETKKKRYDQFLEFIRASCASYLKDQEVRDEYYKRKYGRNYGYGSD